MVLLLAVAAWKDPPLQSVLIGVSVIGWQRSEVPAPPSAALYRMRLRVKQDDGRTVGVASERRLLLSLDGAANFVPAGSAGHVALGVVGEGGVDRSTGDGGDAVRLRA
jgi:hypothetical protein